MKYGTIFLLNDDNYGHVSGVYALGYHYHTLDSFGNCIIGERYALHKHIKRK